MKDFGGILQKQRAFFASGKTLPVAFRVQALHALADAVRQEEGAVLDALRADLGKSPFESYETEVGLVYGELRRAAKELPGWARPRRVPTPPVHFPSSSRIYREPYGVALIMSPWNYPFQLTLAPLVGAIAGGNCVVLKPSAYSPATSAVLAKVLRRCFDEEYVAVVEGGRADNQALLDEPFDTIFFTGSVAVGRYVMQQAAKHLTPVTLELGGKSPCLVFGDADLDLAARRIVWGKMLNAGQTCVAPDYLLVQRGLLAPLLERMKRVIAAFYGDAPLRSPDLPRMVNEKHFRRVLGYLGDGRIEAGGRFDETGLRIEPTLLSGVDPASPVMQEEIFGPVLPALEFDGVGDAAALIAARPKPLALYLFTSSKTTEREILSRVSFGGGCVNDTVVHLSNSAMPFGGVGASGVGGYHGRWSFETFTHAKSVLKKSNRLDIRLRYPPYEGKLGLLKKLLR